MSRRTVRVIAGGFFFDTKTTVAGEEIELPEKVADNWVEAGIAEEIEDEKKSETNETTTTEGTKKTSRRQKKPAETTDETPSETR